MTTLEALAWVVGVLTLIGIIIGLVAWLRPKKPREAPPELALGRVGELGFQKGSPSEHVRAKLELINESEEGSARNWQVSVSNVNDPAVKIARLPHRGSMQIAPVISWQQDGSVGEVPAGQHRELPDWLWVEGPPSTLEVRLHLSIKADGMTPKEGLVIITFPSGRDGPAVQFQV